MKEKNTTMKKIVDNISRVIVGKEGPAKLLVISLAASGHVLIEDVPGIGKTTMAYSMAKSVSLTFNRIQFTPDILPSDITGFTIYNQKTGEFEYRKGNVMSNVILADEINRTSPKTQASMLEVMEEKQVTVDGKTYKVPEPFMVIATENPVEYMGTYPLPEAQLDRFLMKIKIGYPSRAEEVSILYKFQESNPLNDLEAVVTLEELIELQKQVRRVRIDESLAGYIIDIISATRRHDHAMLGCSPRASISLFRAAQAAALYDGRDYVVPEDIRDLAVPVLSHRLMLKQEAKIKRITNESIINDIVQHQKIPVVAK
jgi:MoxR-like ATPase